ELSEKLFLSSATLVPVIDLLEKNGYVKRGQDAHDRRRNPLILTAKGEKVLKAAPLLSEHDMLVEKMKKIGNRKRGELLSNLRFLVAEMIGEKKLGEIVRFAQDVEI